MTRKAKKVSPPISLPSAVKSFLGHLEGTGKADHTIQNYRWDLRQFERFLIQDVGSRNPALLDQALRRLSVRDIEKFGEYLKGEGQKANTRRRRILTVRRFVRYTVSRKKLGLDVAARVPAPGKIERIPHTLTSAEFEDVVKQVSPRRDQALLLLLWETGCTVSEAVRLKWTDLDRDTVTIGGENARRQLRISSTLQTVFHHLHPIRGAATGPVFTAQRGGVAISILPMSTRAVELLFKSYSTRYGIPHLLPRTIRHSVVLAWLQEKVPTTEIKKRLGLKSDYAFRVYQPLVKSQPLEQD